MAEEKKEEENTLSEKISKKKIYKTIVDENLSRQEASERFDLTVEQIDIIIATEESQKTPPDKENTILVKSEVEETEEEFPEDEEETENQFITFNLHLDLNSLINGLCKNYKVTRREAINLLLIYKESYPSLWMKAKKDETILNQFRESSKIDLSQAIPVRECPVCGSLLNEKIGKIIYLLYGSNSMPVSELFKAERKDRYESRG